MDRPKTLFLFGDQTFDVKPHLRQPLDASNNNVDLKSFLENAHGALRNHIFQLPKHERDGLPRFTSIEDVLLWKEFKENSCCVPLHMAIICIYQLGSFIIW